MISNMVTIATVITATTAIIYLNDYFAKFYFTKFYFIFLLFDYK